MKKNVVLAFSLLTLGACSHKSHHQAQNDKEIYEIPVSVSSNDGKSFSLVDADSFSLSLHGDLCTSSSIYAANQGQITTLPVKVYAGDTCTLQVDSLVVSGHSFSMDGAETNSEDWSMSSDWSHHFISTDINPSKLVIQVQSQLSSPVVSSDSVHFAFKGYGPQISGAFPKAKLEVSDVNISGDAPPNLSLVSIAYDSSDSLNPDTGLYNIVLSCTSTIVAGHLCDGIDLDLLQLASGKLDASADLSSSNSDMLFSSLMGSAHIDGSLTSGHEVTVSSSLPLVLGTDEHAALMLKNGDSYQTFLFQ